MGQPVKLSDALVLDARTVGVKAERSIAGQIEFWARLGRAVEPVLRADEALRLKERGDVRPLSECLSSVDSAEGRARLKAALEKGPWPRFEPVRGRPGLLVRVDEDGTRIVGRFAGRTFRPAASR